jgi:hypothetical protein
VDVAEACGISLDGWQRLALEDGLGVRPDGGWAAFEVGLVLPRQNGKNGVVEIRELAGVLEFGEQLIIHSAHLADTSREGFRRLEMILDANEWLSAKVRHIWRTNGHESIEFTTGQRIRFRTRTKGGGRGFSADCVVFDEAMILPTVSVSAILPVVSARPNPQIWYTGSAVDQTIHEDGLVLARVRSRGLAGDDPSLAYLEWSAGVAGEEPLADLVKEPERLADRGLWERANPALGIRISEDHVANELRSMDARTFAVERLGEGDWPDPDAEVGGVIDLNEWKALTDEHSAAADPVCFAIDAPPDRSAATIAAAGFRPDGLAHVEVADSRPGTGWVVPRAVELLKHRPLVFVIDRRGPAASLLHDLKEAGVPVDEIGSNEYANACGLLYDLVDQERLRHLGTTELNASVRVAKTRDLGDAWAWSRKRSSGDISPLVAATLALWGASTQTDTVYSDRGLLAI